MEHSYIGIIGKTIEPIIRPLGYDWKIGIGLVTSFAAREVFVGTLATIYSVGADSPETLKQKMASEKRENGLPVFTLASGISLLLFYAFAMQCMSTLARGQARNKFLEMANNPIDWHDIDCVFYIVNRLSNHSIKPYYGGHHSIRSGRNYINNGSAIFWRRRYFPKKSKKSCESNDCGCR